MIYVGEKNYTPMFTDETRVTIEDTLKIVYPTENEN